METKLVRVPFEVELAKKITEKSVEGRIVTRCGFTARVICWDRFGRDNPLVVLFNNGKDEVVICYNNDGVFSTVKKEDGLDLMLEIPEYMTFKDGDIIAFNECETVLIVKGTAYKNEIGTLYCDCYAVVVNGYLYVDSNVIINRSRFATENEKQKLITALKESKEPKAKEYLKRFFGIEQKQEYEFKPKDWVLCRNGNEEWYLCRFSHVTVSVDRKLLFVAVGGIFYDKCIPYNEQTAHLLGTTDNWEE